MVLLNILLRSIENFALTPEDKTMNKNIDSLEKKAKQGIVSSQRKLGVRYAHGDGIEKNLDKAYYWLGKAEAQGDVEAQCYLGLLYYEIRDFTKALHFLQTAASQGLADAEFYMGKLYYKGEGVEQSFEKAREWWEKAAKQEYPAASYYLSCLYYEGKGVSQNKKSALLLCWQSAQLRFSKAQFALACKFLFGDDIPQDFTKAQQWWIKAASQGHIEAQFNLGNIYGQGQNAIQDILRSYAWFSLVLKNENDAEQLQQEAEKFIASLEMQMTKEQLSQRFFSVEKLKEEMKTINSSVNNSDILSTRFLIHKAIAELQGYWELSLIKFDIPKTKEEAVTKYEKTKDYYLSADSDKNLRETKIKREFHLLSVVALIHNQEDKLKETIRKECWRSFFSEIVDQEKSRKEMTVGNLCAEQLKTSKIFFFKLSENPFKKSNSIALCNEMSTQIKHGYSGSLIIWRGLLKDYYTGFKCFWQNIHRKLKDQQTWNDDEDINDDAKKEFLETEKAIDDAINSLEESLENFTPHPIK